MKSKKTIYFLTPYPKQAAPSQRFRFEQYFDFLENEGYNCEVYPFYSFESWQLLYSQGNQLKKALVVIGSFMKRFGILFKIRKADHLFIHREIAHVGPPIFEWIIANVLRRKYVYDYDDAIWLPNYSETNARFHRIKAYWKVKYCIKWADQVVCGNVFLENYAKKYNQNTRIIPTTIDTENYHNLTCDHNVKPVVIGWTGTHTTMRYLDDLIPVIKKLENKFDFEFLIISNEAPLYDVRSLKYIKWTKENEIQDLTKIHIGVMPLVSDIWSEGKCGFKGLQYMALEMATIMSPVGVNTTIIEHGNNGFLANSEEEWEHFLTILLESETLRRTIGQKGRQTIIEKYSVRANNKYYLELFT